MHKICSLYTLYLLCQGERKVIMKQTKKHLGCLDLYIQLQLLKVDLNSTNPIDILVFNSYIASHTQHISLACSLRHSLQTLQKEKGMSSKNLSQTSFEYTSNQQLHSISLVITLRSDFQTQLDAAFNIMVIFVAIFFLMKIWGVHPWVSCSFKWNWGLEYCHNI